MRRGLKTRGNRFCSAYNYAKNYVRGAYLADMVRHEYMHHCFQLEQAGKTVVDGWVILKCKNCGKVYPDTEKHHCIKSLLVKHDFRANRLCKWCGMPFEMPKGVRGQKYCCKHCAEEARKAQKEKRRKCIA